MAKQGKQNKTNKGGRAQGRSRGYQSKADSNTKRVNYDNARVSKFDKDVKPTSSEADPNYARSGRANDLSWYTRTPALLTGSSRLTFGEVVGTPYSALTAQTVPGIMRIGYNHCISERGEVALNQALNGIYSYTVHANSRNKSYDAVDEGLIILAAGSVFEALALGIRVYGLMQLYDERNAYLPKALVQACGFNFNDLKSNYSHMWFDLNELIVASRQLWIPDVMPVIKRWFWLASNIYMDSASAKSQYYVFTPDSIFIYDETTEETGGSLVNFTDWNSQSQFTWQQYLDMVNSMLSALLESQDRGIIMGDILKAYGPERIFSLNEVDIGYKTVPVYDTEVLTQIENCTVFSIAPSKIVQSTNSQFLRMVYPTYSSNTIINGSVVPLGSSILNFHQKEVPTEGQVMIATRLKCQGMLVSSTSTAGQLAIKPYTAGTETVSTIQTIRRTGVGENGPIDTWTKINANHMNVETPANAITEITQWCAFDWAPWLYFVTEPTSVSAGQVADTVIVNALGDWDNYTLLSQPELQRMHNTAVYSEFGVPTELG